MINKTKKIPFKEDSMSKYVKVLFAIFIISLFLYGNNGFAQNVSKTGTTAAAFLEIGVGAPANGLGGAFVSLANDVSALYWNVSGITNLDRYEAMIVHTDWIADTKLDYAGLVIPMDELGNIGFSLTNLSMEDMKVTTVDKPDGTGEYFTSSDIAIALSYARKLTDRFSVGLTVKYIKQSIWHMSASAFAIDAGTFFKTDLLGGMTIGASMSNFGTPMQLQGRDARYTIRVNENIQGSNDQIPTNIEMDSWELPLFFQIGVSTCAYQTEDFKLNAATDAIIPSNDYQSLNVGAELLFLKIFSLRGGYNSLFLKDSEGGLTFGAGVNSNMLLSSAIISFDYAFRDFGKLKNVHSFSLGIKF